MQLKDWTLVKNKEGEPRAAFAADMTAREWCDDDGRKGFGYTTSRVTLTLPAPPARDPNVIARELGEAYVRYEDNQESSKDDELEMARNRLADEYRAATAPQPPATPSPGRIKPPLVVADILDDGQSWGILDSDGSFIVKCGVHTREEMAYIVAAVNAYAGVPVESAGGE